MRFLIYLFLLTVLATGIVAAESDSNPVFECEYKPVLLRGSHCDSLSYQFNASNPKNDNSGKNIRYQLVDGPGQIDEKTGLWWWKPAKEDAIPFFHRVEVSASCGNSKKNRTKDNSNCRINVIVRDRSPG